MACRRTATCWCAGGSTQLHQEVVGFDDVIRPGDVDFVDSGFKAASLIRLAFLTVLPPKSFTGAIGSIGEERHRRLVERLARYIAGRHL